MPNKEPNVTDFAITEWGDWSHASSKPPSHSPSQQAPQEVLERAKNPAKIRESIMKSLVSMDTAIKESHARMSAIKENEELMTALEMQRDLSEQRDLLVEQRDELNSSDPRFQRKSSINALKSIDHDSESSEAETIEIMKAYLKSMGYDLTGDQKTKSRSPKSTPEGENIDAKQG